MALSRPTPLLALLALLTLLFAGCASRPDSPSGTENPASPDATQTDFAPPASSKGQSASAPTSQTDPAPKLKTLPISVDGKLCPASAGIPAQTMAGLCLVVGGKAVQDRWFHQDIPGTVVGADLTMTWTPSPGASTALQLTFSPVTAVNGGERMTEDRRSVSGDGPLRLELSGLDWKSGAYTVAAWWGGDLAYTPTGQDFHIAGTITYQE